MAQVAVPHVKQQPSRTRKRLARKREEASLVAQSGAVGEPHHNRHSVVQPSDVTACLSREERLALVSSTGALVGNRQLQQQLGVGPVQRQTPPAAAAPAVPTISEADKAEFALLKNRIADADVTAYVKHRDKVFGSTAAYLAYAAVADAELDGTKGLRALVELHDAPSAQTVLYRWLRKAYEVHAGVADVPALIKQGMSKEVKAAMQKVKAAYGKTFRYGGFNPRPKKNAKYRFRLGTVSEHGLGKAVDIEAKKNPILSKEDWTFIETLTGKTVERKRERWQKQPEDLWKDVADLNQRFVKKVKEEVERIEKERAASGKVTLDKKAKAPLDEILGKHKMLKKYKDGFFTLEWALVKALHENGFTWGATFSNAVDLHHFEL
ncbi:MAG: M15 family metallopeptidase [Caldilineaceae bacterium]